MAVPLLVPPYAPSVQGTNMATRIDQTVVKFGMGYSQRRLSALNAVQRVGTWTWHLLLKEEADALIEFLTENAVTGFRYDFPFDNAMRAYVVVGDINDPPDGDFYRQVSIQVEEIFDEGVL